MDKIKLANEIQACMELMTEKSFQHPGAQLALNEAAIQLAQAVIEDSPSRCYMRGYDQGIKEQKEKDADKAYKAIDVFQDIQGWRESDSRNQLVCDIRDKAVKAIREG